MSGPQDKGGHFCVQNGQNHSGRWRAPPISELESQKPEAEFQKSEAGSLKPEVKPRKSEAKHAEVGSGCRRRGLRCGRCAFILAAASNVSLKPAAS